MAPRGIRVHAVNPGPVRTEGFPQNRLQGTRFERFVLEPERVAAAIVHAVEKGKPEAYVFGAYRIVGLLQAALPGTLVRLSARRARSRLLPGEAERRPRDRGAGDGVEDVVVRRDEDDRRD